MSKSESWNRRDFLQKSTGAIAAGLLLGCEVGTLPPEEVASPPPLPSKRPTPSTKDVTQQPLTAKVWIVKTNDRRSGIRKLFEQSGMGWAKGRDVVLKPNLVSAQAFPATTHDDTLREVTNSLRKAGCKQITLGESAGLGRTRAVLESLKTSALCEELNLSLVNFDELPATQWETFDFQGNHWEGGLAIPSLLTDKKKALVWLPCCKTHAMGGHFTMSLKLAVGVTPVGRRSAMHSSSNLPEWVADINAGFAPDFVLMDALSVFVSGGPTVGEEAHPGLLVGGTDRVAVDAVGVAILKQAGAKLEPVKSGKIFEQTQIKRALSINLSPIRGPQDIALMGEPAVTAPLRKILDQG